MGNLKPILFNQDPIRLAQMGSFNLNGTVFRPTCISTICIQNEPRDIASRFDLDPVHICHPFQGTN